MLASSNEQTLSVGIETTHPYLRLSASRMTNLSANALELSGILRPYLWKIHWDIFVQSPSGWGHPRRLDQLVCKDERCYAMAVTLISFLSRLLATYGLVSICFYAQMLVWLRRHIRAREAWACALFPAVVFLMMSWGAAFHPSTGFAMLVMLLLAWGEEGLW